ncbi:hypothetical protein [Candidatus Enterovibrio altilux]|uniref:Mobile element protein n=1 Tax=Candidatus Enterovibrio altilux TaxID=1927128 RepID=A0A291B6M6_9GAMM|nr:hypothetical protein [Candidatus Enterovibrio luxaltus]ATF08659.1 Mobile element protein [Candidatus Enterovibrio luxaltus]
MPYSHCSCISKQTKTVNVAFKIKLKKNIQHVAINFTGLNVYNEDE